MRNKILAILFLYSVPLVLMVLFMLSTIPDGEDIGLMMLAGFCTGVLAEGLSFLIWATFKIIRYKPH